MAIAVRQALEDPEKTQECEKTLRVRCPDQVQRGQKFLDSIIQQSQNLGDDIFVDFAGTVGKRWNYGAAHSVLSDIEPTYIAERGRI